jgi:uncharacterized protein YlxW (UPF0749 family)
MTDQRTEDTQLPEPGRRVEAEPVPEPTGFDTGPEPAAVPTPEREPGSEAGPVAAPASERAVALEAGAQPGAEPDGPPEAEPTPSPERVEESTGEDQQYAGAAVSVAASRLRTALRRGGGRSQLVVAALCALLGFAVVVQVRFLDADSALRTARQSDLVRILDDLNDRSDRLADEVRELQATKDRLQFGSDRAKTALEEAEQRRQVLGILAGTLPARGPGIELRISDPQGRVDAAVLLDTLQELRDAGAEAVQINDLRVIASTDFLDDRPSRVRIDGRVVSAPYLFKVIGDPETLIPALRIPGGVFAVLADRGANATVERRDEVVIDALRPVQQPQYARPAADPGGTGG